jgi:hypothetical protein
LDLVEQVNLVLEEEHQEQIQFFQLSHQQEEEVVLEEMVELEMNPDQPVVQVVVDNMIFQVLKEQEIHLQ